MKNKLLKVLPILMDFVLIGFAFYLAFALRFGFEIPKKYYDIFLTRILWVVIFKIAVFYLLGYYRLLWRHASLREVVETLKTISISSFVVVFALFVVQSKIQLPRSVVFMDWLLTLCLVGGSRLLVRLVEETSPKYLTNKQIGYSLRSKHAKKVLIIGAGEAGSILVKKMLKYPAFGYEPVAFVDDNPKKHGYLISGIPVMGGVESIESLIDQLGVDEAIIALPSASGEIRKKIVFMCEELGIPCKTTPSIAELVHSEMELGSIRNIQVEDILGRDPVNVDIRLVASSIENKVVMVTGAAGSIGSELCRQIIHFAPKQLIALDISENGLYCLKQDLAKGGISVIFKICDVKDKKSIEKIFTEYNPGIVFHAAAYKHVPLMQDHPVEAVSNNLIGAKIVADVANDHNAENFIFISTDKAVNPVNIMGYSKALAEKYFQTLAAKSDTKYTIVRFGNVLGSSGSVVPLFQSQIQKMGPLTLTHPKMERYFMTVQEAVQLVIHAGTMGSGGEVFVLDMGEPVPILELAENMIRLAGYEPYSDIEVKFIGIRSGEKLSEELFLNSETKIPTEHHKIFMAKTHIDRDLWEEKLEEIINFANQSDSMRLLSLVTSLFGDKAEDEIEIEDTNESLDSEMKSS